MRRVDRSARSRRCCRLLFVGMLRRLWRVAGEHARREDGLRTFKLAEGEPLPTSHGEDLYERILGEAARSGD